MTARAAVILAAGQGTRMNSDLPKVLHPVGAAPLLHHAMRAAQSLDPDRTIVVTGHGAEAVGKADHRYATMEEVMDSVKRRRAINQPVLDYLKDK